MMRVVLICINMRKMHMSSSGVEHSMPRSTFLQLRILLRKGTSTAREPAQEEGVEDSDSRVYGDVEAAVRRANR